MNENVIALYFITCLEEKGKRRRGEKGKLTLSASSPSPLLLFWILYG
jgi:hypothetical protein